MALQDGSILVTGFGPFDAVAENPSAELASSCGTPFRIIEVAFQAVDDFLDELSSRPPGALLMLGVAERAERMRLETVARNHVGARADVRGDVRGPAPIDPTGPQNLAATLWREPWMFNEGEIWEPSVDAGGYLCNYIFYRALRELPRCAVGFLHVPLIERVPLVEQAKHLGAVLSAVGAPIQAPG